MLRTPPNLLGCLRLHLYEISDCCEARRQISHTSGPAKRKNAVPIAPKRQAAKKTAAEIAGDGRRRRHRLSPVSKPNFDEQSRHHGLEACS
jgi:hypothetical protein